MSFSLDTPSAATLKAEAKHLRAERALAGTPLTHGAALEEVAHSHGYRDWNTAVAALPERVATPVQVGQRVKGTYLKQPFTGLVIGVQQLLSDMQHYKVTVKFDKPVEWSPPSCSRPSASASPPRSISTASRPPRPAIASRTCGSAGYDRSALTVGSTCRQQFAGLSACLSIGKCR